MVKQFATSIVVFSLTVSLAAQQGHVHPGLAPTQEIDGSVNPEKIPDSTAYRLFFLVAGTAPNSKSEEQAKEQAKQQAHIRKVGLSTEDSQLLIPILNDFRTQYAELIQRHNNYADAAARGQVPDFSGILAERDALVQSTRDKLKLSLSQNGMERLQQHVENEKHNIKIVIPSPAK